jgi:hypothetical protein
MADSAFPSRAKSDHNSATDGVPIEGSCPLLRQEMAFTMPLVDQNRSGFGR